MDWIIGIDGGGTKTTGIAADSCGNIFGRTEQGPSNYHITGVAEFKNVVVSIVNELATICYLPLSDLKVISLGVAGADRQQDRDIISIALAELNLGCHFIINSDAQAALMAGLGKDGGIVLIAGTGSIAYGVNNKTGEMFRAGGWGHVVSDEGSGYAIGRQALIRSIKGAEGRGKSTALLPLILAHFNLQNWDELIGFVNNHMTTKDEIASLARIVGKAAMAGDSVASEILLDAGDDLAGLVESVISRGFQPGEQVKVCLFGSIVNNLEIIRNRIKKALAGKATFVACEKEAAVGAMLTGLDWMKKKER